LTAAALARQTCAVKKILIVDDEPAVLFALSEALADRRRGVKVATATSGGEAVALLESERVDLVVTDLRMPGMDGFELMAWLRRGFPHLPVIVMTAYAADSARLGQGLDFLEKPFDLGVLKEKASDMLRQSVKGRVENISLSSFLQLLEIERKTCTLGVTIGEQAGRLFFRGGRLVGAHLVGDQTEGSAGQAAALEIVTWEHADIEISDGCAVTGPELESGLHYLLMEGMRLKDERERHAPYLPGIAQETDDAIEALLSQEGGAVQPAVVGEGTETVREALERGRAVEGSLATLLVETANGRLIAAAIGSKGVDVEVAARATAELARQKPRVEATVGLKDAVEEMLLTTHRRYYLLRPVGANGRMFLLLVLDRSKASLPEAQEELAAMEKELTEKALA
jgi:CheY-like chemotaxis protein